MSLHPADAAELLVVSAEAGGSAAVAVLVGNAESAAAGRRFAYTAARPGAEAAVHGSFGSDGLDRAAQTLLEGIVADPRGRGGLHSLSVEEESCEVYVEVRRPVLELVIVGAGHVAQPVSHVGSLLGYRVTVLDDRPDFATRERFPDADRLVRADFDDPFRDVPLHERSHILLVTRGHKYDYECLIRALRMTPPPGYIGMIGSRRRVRATYVQLLDEGIDRTLLDRIHAPVGLDIGAETPEEIAVSVAAELVMHVRGGTGRALKDVERVAGRFFPESTDP